MTITITYAFFSLITHTRLLKPAEHINSWGDVLLLLSLMIINKTIALPICYHFKPSIIASFILHFFHFSFFFLLRNEIDWGGLMWNVESGRVHQSLADNRQLFENEALTLSLEYKANSDRKCNSL